ncbi:MAG TPA: serine hydrolase [Thermoanaerobaculia bacterium]|nr:serine hydrolase [Thermoanaerobaculia bacterium]
MRRPPAALLAALAVGCMGGVASGPRATGEARLEDILASHPGLAPVLAAAREHRLQVVLGLVEEGADGRPVLLQHRFRAGAEYLYPASTVKLFAAVAALERLAELRAETGLPIDQDTPLVYHRLFAGEERVDHDPSNSDGGAVTVRHEIRKLFLVSDNEAFNRLYELVGQDRLAASLARAGLGEARIAHRLSEPRNAEENRTFPRIDFVGDGFVHTLPQRQSPPLPAAPAVPGLQIGDAYVAGDETVQGAMDFSVKNRVALAALQRGLCMVVRPDVACGGPGYALADADRELLLEAMSQYPRESDNPVYDPDEYPDAWGKYLLPGVARVVSSERLRIYNKYGQAYGFTLDNAWVVDRGTGQSFFLAVALYTNADGVLNDDRYEYDEVALPFLADLGEAVARHLWGAT